MKIIILVEVLIFGLICNRAFALPLVIVPPPSLTLDGMSIVAGNFVLTGATGYSDPGGVLTQTTFLDAGNVADDINISATIGGTTPHSLFDVPVATEVLHLEGFFDAASPNLPPAVFDITLGVLNDASADAFTYFLPSSTSDFLFQITDLGSNLTSEIDNIDTFVDGIQPVVALSLSDPSLTGLTVLTLDNGIDNPWYVGVAPVLTMVSTGAVGGVGVAPANCGFTTSTVQRHGRSTSIQTPVACTIPEPNSISLIVLGLLLSMQLKRRGKSKS